jgi:hypothetical protein
MVQAEARGRVKGFGLFASPTRNTLEELGADICSVTDIFVFSLRARNGVLKCTLPDHAKVSTVAKLRGAQAPRF